MSTRQSPVDDLLVSMGLAGIFGGVALAFVAWLAGMVAIWVSHGVWPQVSPAAAGAILIGVAQHPGDPAQAWPTPSNRLMPSAAVYWSTLGAMLAVLAASGGVAATRLMKPAPSRRWPHTNPRRLGYVRGADLDRRHRRRSHGHSWRASYDAWLGFERGALGRLVPLRGQGDRQTAGVVGPPGSGKTLGLILPNLVSWTGSAIVTSTKTDVLQLAMPCRNELAKRVGGEVHLVDWAELVAPLVGMKPVGFDILDGCRDSRVVSNRTEALVGATEAPHGDGTDDRFWKQGAGLILRPYLHAAALGSLGIGQVLEWLDQQEFHEPGQIIDRENPAAAIWGDRLRGLSRSPSVTIGGYFETAKSVFAALQEPVVLGNCQRSELDVERFLETCSTLFLIDPAGEARLSPTAPLTAALIDWIADRAYARGRQLPLGVCEPRLGLFLDELPNIAPLSSLGRHLSQGSSQGVNVAFWSSQTFGQLVARFGEHEASTIWSLTRYTVLFGGGKEADWLEKVSRLAGDYEDSEESSTRTREGTTVTRQRVRRPILPVESLARIPRGEAVLVAEGRVVRILTPPAPTVRRLAAQLKPLDRASGVVETGQDSE